jgi:L,D-transpeptidase YcbB
MRYISDVRIGKINPRHFKFGYDVAHKKLDLPTYLAALLSKPIELSTELASIEPPFAAYKLTRVALLHYTDLAKRDDGEQLPAPPGILFPGGPYAGTARLVRLLRQFGDLSPDAIVSDPSTYSGPIPDAVKRFQTRHGLPADGYLTRETVNALNVPLRNRVEQLRLTLERFRWLRYSFVRPPIVVNLPAFRLRALDDNGQTALTMNVNVGDAYDFQTPVFEDRIRYVVFRPYWNVPPQDSSRRSHPGHRGESQLCPRK